MVSSCNPPYCSLSTANCAILDEASTVLATMAMTAFLLKCSSVFETNLLLRSGKLNLKDSLGSRTVVYVVKLAGSGSPLAGLENLSPIFVQHVPPLRDCASGNRSTLFVARRINQGP
jgi:hypothetical protein